MRASFTLAWPICWFIVAFGSTSALAGDSCPVGTDEQVLESLVPAKNLAPHLRRRWKSDLGHTRPGSGEPHLWRNDFRGRRPTEPAGPGVNREFGVTISDFQNMGPRVDREVIVRLAHISDSHVFDEESPARQYWSGWLVPTIYRYQEAHTTQILDAAVKTVNRLNECDESIDFAVLSGDLVNNHQRNELGWFVDVLDGREVHPDSGADDDPLTGPDPHDPFLAEGLDIPWYATVGNHDLLFEGHSKTHLLTGSPTRSQARFVVEPACDNMGSLPVICQIDKPTSHYHHRRVDMVADDERASVDKFEIIEALLESTTSPKGHGFTPQHVENQTAYWTATPKAGVPLRLINLDTSAPSGVFGRLDRQQLDFLESELAHAEVSGELVVLTSHHSSMDLKSGWGRRLRRVLWRHPNVVLHLAGHRHRHRIRARQPAILPPSWRPEQGYWEILTSSLIDWPQQLRLVEIGLGDDGLGAMRTTVVDYEAPPNSVAADARFYALYGRQSPPQTLLVGGGSGKARDRNA
ncbi:MAG: hypothetical protein HN348_13905, partial [Proteobacteria bacterium]|nr:hypothetical protein [Pseudomonadota bacterium]